MTAEERCWACMLLGMLWGLAIGLAFALPAPAVWCAVVPWLASLAVIAVCKRLDRDQP